MYVGTSINSQSNDKESTIYFPYPEQHSLTGRVGRWRQVIHAELSHGTIFQWVKAVVHEFSDTVIVISIFGAGNVYIYFF